MRHPHVNYEMAGNVVAMIRDTHNPMSGGHAFAAVIGDILHSMSPRPRHGFNMKEGARSRRVKVVHCDPDVERSGAKILQRMASNFRRDRRGTKTE